MADYSRRNKGSSVEDDFDWESFDRKTAERSTLSNDTSETLRRRRSRESAPEPAPRRRPASTGSSSGRAAESRTTSKDISSENSGTASTKAVSKRRKRPKKQLTEKQKRIRRNIRTTVLVVFLICFVICSGMMVGMYAAVSREIKDMNISSLALNTSSVIYYPNKDGSYSETEEMSYKLISDSNRIWKNSNEIPQVFKDAIVSIEDERFYKHHGVDVKRTLGATVGFVASKLGMGNASYGGSTITQQVIKNITNENEVRATRKIKEMMRAIALERQLTKDEILNMYCNIVYFANNCNGVEAASLTYFNKHAIDLNLQEAASIAGITQFPSQYDPIANPNNNVEKRNTVLKKMYELGKISEAEYNTAVNSPLELSDDYLQELSAPSSYFADQVVNDIIRDLIQQKGYSEDFATRQLYNGGLKIYATVDVDIQETMEDVFANKSNFPGSSSGAQAAMVITDPYTGQVKGLIGGLGEKTDIRGWNRATQAVRQPGSAIKPLSVYGPAVDRGEITETDIVTDEEIEIGNDNWKPKNSYSGFKGDMTIIEAVARSANIPAVKVLDVIGLTTSYDYLKNKFHISTLQDGDKNYSSLALGGLTQGVTVKDMAAAYGVFANRGRYITPYTYTKVTDSAGNDILVNNINQVQAMSEAAAYITANLLSGPVNLSYGTAKGAKLSCGMPAYGKTGTTDDDFDKWFVGFTPYYVGAVWFGFDSPSSLKAAGISGNPCVTAWNLVMDEISEYQTYKKLDKPSTVVECEVCTLSGNLANSDCESITAYYVDGTQPKKECTNHYSRKESSSFANSGGTPTPAVSSAPSVTTAPVESTAAPNGGNSIGNSDSTSSGTVGSGGASGTSGSTSGGGIGHGSSGTASGGTTSGGSLSGGGISEINTAPSSGGSSGSEEAGGADSASSGRLEAE